MASVKELMHQLAAGELKAKTCSICNAAEVEFTSLPVRRDTEKEICPEGKPQVVIVGLCTNCLSEHGMEGCQQRVEQLCSPEQLTQAHKLLKIYYEP
jgi:hypothetical protein